MTAPATGRPVSRRGWIVAASAVAAIALAVAGRAWWITAAAPRWWAEAGRLPPDAAERAAALERGLTRVLNEPSTENEPWSVSIRDADVNAWLVHRFPAWASNRSAPWSAAMTDGSIGPPRVWFHDGRVSMGCAVRAGWSRRVVGASCVPVVSVDPSGRTELRLTQSRIILGRLEDDGHGALRKVIDMVEEASRAEFLGILDGSRPALSPAAWPLDAAREVRLIEVAVEDGRLIVTCRTGPGRD